ncbi:DUF6262 family protein [Pseudomonas sp.]|uniref:DUF6262 family protein n=1 Tax=Pseudomonas sp. TaxID=306 RepID=UPI0028ACCF71|nr:DUF6262 family protein [Pseudomonas sp.]
MRPKAKTASEIKIRKAWLEAITAYKQSLKDGAPALKITVSLIAKKAGISRSLVYKNHPEIIEKIKTLNNSKNKKENPQSLNLSITSLKEKCKSQKSVIAKLASENAKLLLILEQYESGVRPIGNKVKR